MLSVNQTQLELRQLHASEDSVPTVFGDIYQNHINITNWQRRLDKHLTQAISNILTTTSRLALSVVVSPDDIHQTLYEQLGENESVKLLSDDITHLTDMFCCLFDLKKAGLRLTILDRAMCPRFHVDRIPCRLITTYQGIATEWLPNQLIDRRKLGAGNQGKPDEHSGLFSDITDICQLNVGDVALLKGEHWHSNEGKGLVHRSPAVSNNERRLLLTLDFINE